MIRLGLHSQACLVVEAREGYEALWPGHSVWGEEGGQAFVGHPVLGT